MRHDPDIIGEDILVWFGDAREDIHAQTATRPGHSGSW